MSSGEYFECIIVYSDLYIGVPKKKYFKSQGINLAPRCAYETVLLKISFYSKKYSTGDDSYSGYYNLSPSIVNLNINGSDFSWR